MHQAPLIARLLPTLFEDRRLLVVAKPAGVDVGAMAAPGGEPQRGVVEVLAELRPELPPLLPVNRLSRFESGVLILAKTAEAAASLRAQWKDGGVEQEYVAVVVGRPEKRRITIGGDDGEAAPPQKGRRQPAKGRSAAAVKAVVRKPAATTEAAGVTTINLIHQGERRAAVRCRTHTPNTHILRAQLRSGRMRVLGDHLKDPAKRRTPVEQTFLHLARVSLILGEGEKPIVFRHEPPIDPIVYVNREFDVARFLHASVVRRLPLLAAEDTDCFRLITGPAEGLRGVVAEKFGGVVILQVHDDRAVEADLLRIMARWYRDVLGVKTVCVKSFAKGGRSSAEPGWSEGGAKSSRGRPSSDRPLLGPPTDDEIVVTENGLRFAIRTAARQSVGLFLDQRDNRKRIRELSAGKDVLNLFAYTCGFSVAAAAGGARHTSSVDISPKHLDWGRRNFELNGIDTTTASVADRSESGSRHAERSEASPVHPSPDESEILRCAQNDDENESGASAAQGESGRADGSRASTADAPPHLFFKSDATDFLKRAKRQGRLHDIIILDAPSFAHARGKGGGSSFSIERDLASLVRDVVEVLRPGGTMLISTNYRQLTVEGMRRRIREGAGHRKLTFGPPPPLPIDFAADADHAKSLWAHVD